MGQAWLTLAQARDVLTQARDVLTEARNALTEASLVAYAAWARMGARGEWRCKWRWGAGLGGKLARTGALLVKTRPLA